MWRQLQNTLKLLRMFLGSRGVWIECWMNLMLTTRNEINLNTLTNLHNIQVLTADANIFPFFTARNYFRVQGLQSSLWLSTSPLLHLPQWKHQQWGGVFFLVSSEAVTGRAGSPLLLAFRKNPRTQEYIYWASQPELQKDEVVRSRHA
jgi:hypothetical protein